MESDDSSVVSDDEFLATDESDECHRLRIINEAIRRRRNGMLAKHERVYATAATHEAYVRANSSCKFTNIIREFFTNALMKRLKRVDTIRCEECGSSDKIQRCHTLSRPEVLHTALDRLCPNEDVDVEEIDLVVEFLRLHARYPLKFKCARCHQQEGRPSTDDIAQSLNNLSI
tara:strand:- start:984 stop:1502 length:519 start_codon:yes stop_codon:yes gene_type:complete